MKFVEFIHRDLGVKMQVAENRVEEYKAAGHRLAVEAEKPAGKPKRKKTSKK